MRVTALSSKFARPKFARPLFALLGGAAVLAVLPNDAQAKMPEGVQAMIDAAIEEGDPEQVAMVLALARKVSPEDAALFDQIARDFAAKSVADPANPGKPAKGAKLAAATPTKTNAAPPAKPVTVAKAAPSKPSPPPEQFFDNWSGRGEIGGFRNTGNSTNSGLSAALRLKRAGRMWNARLQAQIDYQRSQGEKTRERYFALAEPQFTIGENGFAYGLAQWERDKFRGLASRTAISGGVGFKPVISPDLQLEIKFGPAWRSTRYADSDRDVEEMIAALAASNLDWKLSKNVTLRNEMSAYLGSDNDSFSSLSALEFALTRKLRASVSYLVEHDTNPPGEALSTDTLTRFSLIYGF